ncbi:MAG: hypothetical protein R6W68_09450 [Ignavibacteriaceae bacterium]
MNKMLKFSILFLALVSLSFMSCSDSPENEFKINNASAADLELNFRAELITVPSGEEFIINDLPKGSFSYESIFVLPAGITDATIEGATSGTIEFFGGTKALLYIVSNFGDSTMTIFASLTQQEDVNFTGLTDPLSNP